MARIVLAWLLLASALLGGEPVVLQLKWLHQFQFAGYYAAKEKGFYEAEGLDVEIKERDLSKDQIEQVIAGEADYGVSDSVLLLYRERGRPVVIVAPIFQHSPNIILTLAESGIDTPYKLEGRHLTFYANDSDGLNILSMLQTLDVHPNIVRLKEKTDYRELVRGNTDAYACYLTNEPFYLMNEGVDFNIINPANYGFDLYGDMLFTSEREAKEHPERVRRFKAATIRGWQYAMEHKEEIIDLIHRKYATNKSLEHLRYEANALEEMIQYHSIPIGTLDVGRIEYILGTYEKFGIIKRNVPIGQYIFEPNRTVADLSEAEQDFLKQKGEIRMCIDPNWMPFEKNDHGRHVGISADYIRLLEAQLGIPITMVPTRTWRESLAYGRERKCDIFSLVMPTEERRHYLDFTQPYLKMPLVIVTNNDALFINDIGKVTDRTIGIPEGYAFGEILRREYPNMQIVDVPNLKRGLEMVEDGKLFGMIATLGTAAYEIQRHFIGQLKIAGKFEQNWELGIGTRNDEPMLRSIFDKALETISDEERQAILNRWISVSYDRGVNYTEMFKWLGGIVAVFAVILLVMLRSNRILNLEIKRRESIEQQLKRYIDLVDRNIITCTTDSAGKIVDVSTAFCKISGYAREELIGRDRMQVRHPDVTPESVDAILQILRRKHVWSGELKYRNRSGKTFWLNAHISELEDEVRGGLVYTAIMQDITNKKRLEELSITDPLTGIYNRRHYNQTLPKVVNRAKRDAGYVLLALSDVDHFKLYNDTYGHLKGDQALQSVATIFTNSLKRADDYCFRMGGEEFAILAKGVEPDKAQAFIDAIRERIQRHGIAHSASTTASTLTVSFGLIVKPARSVHNVNELYKEADDLLYQAKERGRNTVVARIEL